MNIQYLFFRQVMVEAGTNVKRDIQRCHGSASYQQAPFTVLVKK
jgi:ribosomal protein L22